MIHCIAIDDEPIALDVISNFCKKIPGLELIQCFTQTSAAKRYVQNFPVDLIFMDIEMPDVNGLEFYKSLPQNLMVIFTTAHSQYAIEGFNVDAIDFLLKPIEFERFQQACQKAFKQFDYLHSTSNSSDSFLSIRADYSLIRIPYNEITYCETMNDYVKIHRINNEPVTTLITLNKLMQKLPEKEFMRIHRSFIVSLSKIEHIRANSISIQDKTIPLGVTYKKDFHHKLNNL